MGIISVESLIVFCIKPFSKSEQSFTSISWKRQPITYQKSPDSLILSSRMKIKWLQIFALVKIKDAWFKHATLLWQ